MPFHSNRLYFRLNWYIRYPSTAISSDYYLQPFDTYLWLALLSIVFFTTLLIIFIQNLIRNEKRNFVDSLFLAIESFCNQCGNDYLENVSIRIVSMLLRLFGILSIGLYGAIITSFLAVEIPRPPFTTLQGFIDNGQYKFEIYENSSLLAYLRASILDITLILNIDHCFVSTLHGGANVVVTPGTLNNVVNMRLRWQVQPQNLYYRVRSQYISSKHKDTTILPDRGG